MRGVRFIEGVWFQCHPVEAGTGDDHFSAEDRRGTRPAVPRVARPEQRSQQEGAASLSGRERCLRRAIV